MTKSPYLFPAGFKKFGWLILIPCLIVGAWYLFFGKTSLFTEAIAEILNVKMFAISAGILDDKKLFLDFTNTIIFDEIVGLCLIGSGLLVGFSKEKDEDELISALRMKCLVWAIYWSYGITALGFIFFYDWSFLDFMSINIYTPLLLFIIKFNWSIISLRKSLNNEE